MSNDSVRLDKWLWAVRVFKTRTLAAEACRGGHVRVNEDPAKPAREIRVGDVVVVRREELTRTLRVKGLIEKRVGGALVPENLEDLTPPEEYERARQRAANSALSRAPGSGRPTKKERRLLDQLLGSGPEPETDE